MIIYIIFRIIRLKKEYESENEIKEIINKKNPILKSKEHDSESDSDTKIEKILSLDNTTDFVIGASGFSLNNAWNAINLNNNI